MVQNTLCTDDVHTVLAMMISVLFLTNRKKTSFYNNSCISVCMCVCVCVCVCVRACVRACVYCGSASLLVEVLTTHPIICSDMTLATDTNDSSQ